MHEALNNWGNVLSDQAKTKQGDEADALFALAGEKYAAALAIKPDKHEALSNWGAALLTQANTKQGDEANALFALAGEKFAQGEAILEGSCAYNLACLHGLLGDARKSAEWLLKAKNSSKPFPGCAHVTADLDFDKVRNTKVFAKALKDVGC